MEKKSGQMPPADGDFGDEEEKDSSEEIEPKLKYVRITNDLQNILCKDAASCIAVHPKFICIGSHWGALHLFDHQGNSVRSQDLQAHTVMVNQISIDERGDHIASCSDDGRVFINGLYSPESSQSLVLHRLIKCVAIDPYYFKSSTGRRFITGDERLMVHEKAFLSRRSTILAEAEGHVNNIKWCGRFVAWASSVGLRVYDIEARCSLGLIKWPRSPNLQLERFRCNLFWKDVHTLLVGWVDSVRVCLVRRRNPAEVAENKDLPDFKVEQIFNFHTDFYLCGIAPLDNNLVLLGYPKELDENGKAQRPQLYVVEPKDGGDFDELSTDCLSLRGYQQYTCNDYHLDCLIEESRFFIISPKDVVVASPYDADDRIQWLIEHERYEAAMEEVANADKKELRRHTLIDVGHSYIEHLLAKGRYTEAAQLCVKILGQDQKLWEEEVFKFARHQQLRALSPYLPRGQTHDSIKLNPHVYEMVLYEYIKTDHRGFLNLVKELPPSLYNLPAIVNAVMEHLLQNRPHERKDEMQELLEALAILYLHQQKFSKAFCMLVKFKNPEVFSLIKQHKHYDCLLDIAVQLMELDASKATALFLEQNKVPPSKIVSAIEHNKYLLFLYLDALERRDGKSAGKEFQHLLVELYAEYAKDRLLSFLRHGDQYPIETALEICQKRKFYPEMVYLLGRIGKTREALTLIVKELQDIKQAVEFCKEHDDPELWEEMIASTVHRPDFATYLLQKIGTYIDPQMLIKRIENGCVIEGLKNSLVKLLCDYQLQVSVQEGCKKILVSDYFNLHKRQVALQMRGVAIHEDSLCGVCSRPCVVKNPCHNDGLIVFYCRHSFHEQCLSASAMISCVVCQPTRRVPRP
ncbi:vacuolar protein sorting-associated protein 41 homolog [Neocloeon triangulifer]|uniref:vacuolar protein sorting-associated protein 41 homolog n=1 Tax=Neocloeon triangulifer TaxID=2078957 RepID=UPI00286F013A|nr:vacuolar protein sorting-associated protein 41 homolog [Neocloeon triangulifer]